MTDIISIFLVMLLAILLIGPRRLPAGVEALWLAWTNFSRSQHGGDPISLDTARMQWQRESNPLWNGVQLLYAATEHLIEGRSRWAYSLHLRFPINSSNYYSRLSSASSGRQNRLPANWN